MTLRKNQLTPIAGLSFQHSAIGVGVTTGQHLTFVSALHPHDWFLLLLQNANPVNQGY